MSYLSDDVPDTRQRGGLRRRVAVLARGPELHDDPGRWAVRAFALAAGLSAGASAVIYLLLTLHTFRIPFVQLWAFGSALLLVPWALRMLHGPPPDPEPGYDPNQAEVGLRPVQQADRWRHRLDTTSDDVDRFTTVVRSRMVALVEQRLRLRHGVRLVGDPERALPILGRPLYQFLTEPLPRPPTPYELERLVTRIEEI